MATFAGDRSMRVNYEQGVDAYYESSGAKYRNPHFGSIVAATQEVMEAWWAAAQPEHEESIRILDLACGSGEATQAIEAWWQGKQAGRGGGKAAAGRGPARQFGAAAGGGRGDVAVSGQAATADTEIDGNRNSTQGGVGETVCQADLPRQAEAPHEAVEAGGDGADATARKQQASTAAALEGPPPNESQSDHVQPAAAAGAAAQPPARPPPPQQQQQLQRLPQMLMDACDPYTYEAFEKWVGRPAERWTFQDIADGCLSDRFYNLAISSYALHVMDDSKLFSTLMQLSLVTAHLVVLSPHKKPYIGEHMGWHLVQHSVVERVHAWLYESSNVLR